MNRTEWAARRWIAQRHNVSEQEIIFSPTRTPDFVTPDGSKYEVKRLYRSKIILYPAQVATLRQQPDITVVVFSSSSFEPATLMSAAELLEALDDGSNAVRNVNIVSMGDKYLVSLPANLSSRYQQYHDSNLLPEDKHHSAIFARALEEFLEKRGY